MGILAFLIQSIASVVDLVIGLYKWMLIIAVLITWVNPDPFNPIVQFLRQATEPFFRKVKEIIPFPVAIGGMDFSPIIAIVLLEIAGGLVLRILGQFAIALK